MWYQNGKQFDLQVDQDQIDEAKNMYWQLRECLRNSQRAMKYLMKPQT